MYFVDKFSEVGIERAATDSPKGSPSGGTKNCSNIVIHDVPLIARQRSLAFLESNEDCAPECWDRLVDFMHASQWQNLDVNHAIYQNMRSQGLPMSVVLTDAVEVYLAQVRGNVMAFEVLPVYRSLVRQLVRLEAQEFYRAKCWSLVDCVEEYVLDCPEGIPPDEARMVANDILNAPGIEGHLTEWVGAIVSLPQTLGDQSRVARRAVDLIDLEIETR